MLDRGTQLSISGQEMFAYTSTQNCNYTELKLARDFAFEECDITTTSSSIWPNIDLYLHITYILGHIGESFVMSFTNYPISCKGIVFTCVCLFSLRENLAHYVTRD